MQYRTPSVAALGAFWTPWGFWHTEESPFLVDVSFKSAKMVIPGCCPVPLTRGEITIFQVRPACPPQTRGGVTMIDLSSKHATMVIPACCPVPPHAGESLFWRIWTVNDDDYYLQ